MNRFPSTLRLLDQARHRNGIGGAPFSVVLFEDGESRKLGILFDAPDHCAVFDLAKLAQGDIAFGSNSYRGDCYEAGLRRIITHHNPSHERNS